MRLWRVILLVNLALALGLMLGYLAWGRDVLRLEQELQQARRQQAVAGGARSWQARGVEILTARDAADLFEPHFADAAGERLATAFSPRTAGCSRSTRWTRVKAR